MNKDVTDVTRKIEILKGYATGAISRSEAMSLLGLDWYATLLDELAKAKIDRPVVDPETRKEMVNHATRLLRGETGN